MATFNTLGIEGDIRKLAPIVARWEGGYVNDPLDAGGATNMGVTIGAWKHVAPKPDKDGDGDVDAADMKLLTKDDFQFVMRKYWDKWRADEINNQSLANILVDWYWGSGKWGIVIPQRLLGVVADGKVGAKTIAAINAAEPAALHRKIYAARLQFLNNIVAKRPDQRRFIAGWINRLNDFKFKP